MLQGTLSGLRGFPDAKRAGKVPNYREAEPLRFVDDGEIGIARKSVVHFETIGALMLKRIYGCPRLIGGLHGNGELWIGP